MHAPNALPVQNVLAVRGVHKSYALGQNRIEVLKGVDLEVGQGEAKTSHPGIIPAPAAFR